MLSILKSITLKVCTSIVSRTKPSYRRNSNLSRCLQLHEIIPDVIDDPPKELAQIFYNEPVELGNELTPMQVKDPPCATWPADKWTYYTLIMLDPDVPSRCDPSDREWHHWLIGNIPGNKLSKGQVVYKYIGVLPHPDTGLHRYVFLIFEQPCEVHFSENHLTDTSVCGRSGNSVRHLMCKYSLVPYAANFFVSQWDCYVPTLCKQLGIWHMCKVSCPCT